MKEGVDHRGEELPGLTKRSRNVNLERIIKLHKPDFTDARLTSKGMWLVIRGMMRYGQDHVMGKTWYHYHGEDPNKGPGVLTVAWHTAGLIDPLLIILKIDKPFVFAGRQDVLTGPIIGWWGRRMGVQPLLRQAERLRGHVDDETATRINSASMLTVASKLAHGQASILLPEGHSHCEWHIIRLRTGPIRSALNAAALARELGNDVPVILPVGLTFRDPHAWFSEVLVEFGESLTLPELPDKTHGGRLLAGEWVEPDKVTTLKVRDELRDRLGCLTPDAPDLKTWQAWRLLGHLSAELKGERLTTWKDEVLHGREIRDRLRGSSGKVWQGPEACGEPDLASSSEITVQARTVVSNLDAMRLDARAVHADAGNLDLGKIAFTVILLPLVLLSIPLAIVGNGLQALIGLIMAKYNGEAIDKRTTFHLMPMVLGIVFVRPFVHSGTTALILCLGYFSEYSPIYSAPILFIFLWFATDGATIWCRKFYRNMCSIRRGLRTRRARRRETWTSLGIEIEQLKDMLGALK